MSWLIANDIAINFLYLANAILLVANWHLVSYGFGCCRPEAVKALIVFAHLL